MKKSGLQGKRILVTGAGGFIGSHLSGRLLDEGAEVHAVLKKDSDLSRLSGHLDSIKTYQGSITDSGFINSVLGRANPEIVFHLAGILKKDISQDSLASNIQINFYGTCNLLNGLVGKDIQRFVFISTSEGYTGSTPFSEEHKRIPVSPYSASKICTETICEFFSRNYKIPITILRPFIVYGPGQGKGMLIPDVITSLLEGIPPKTTKGEQTRDFVYIEDVVEALLLVSLKKEAAGEAFNICSGKESKIKDVVLAVGSMTGGKVKPEIGGIPYNQNETWRHFGDNKKLRSIGWEPKTGIEEGLRKTVEWYKSHKNRPDFIAP